MDVLSIALGIVIGAIVTIMAVGLSSSKKPETAEPVSRYAESWSLDGLSNPRIVAEYLLDADIPRNARVVVKQCKDTSILKGLDVRYNPDVKGCFALGDDRAIILSGPFKNGEVALINVEKHVLNRLNDVFESYWEKGVKPKNL
ncbi:MAG: hypothetical protein J7L32_05455 [Thermoplasmata archaeon]|nr:hypothetical protein [Thermoplasmata archaeon]RLF26780.1 MAG: hypothetical protein DRN01_03985 [Thermoplasmata archaeon]